LRTGLNSAGLLDLWEACSGATPARQALALLAAARPEAAPEALAALPLGESQQRILELRRCLFGDTLEAVSTCPQCGEELEAGLDLDDLLRSSGDPPVAAEIEVEVGDLRLRARLLTTADLLAAEASGEVEGAARRLGERSILEARREGTAVAKAEDLDEHEMAALAEALADADPMADVVFDLACAACGHEYRQLFDAAVFVTTEIEVQARRLLGEVHTLARAYGWREADVLALSTRRRQLYLELLAS
jgi:hypothetical protein